MDQLTASVIIPTYNRKESLLRSLTCLQQQTYPADRLEIIVVDDGGNEDIEAACASVGSNNLRYIRQQHAGGTQAKNTGAVAAQGDILIFLDDDITVVPEYVSALMRLHGSESFIIAFGRLLDVNPVSGHMLGEMPRTPASGVEPEEVSFLECLGGFFSIRRTDFVGLGMLDDPAPGWWPNWEDVDLAYRAHIRGFRFYRSVIAIGYHWDHSLTSHAKTCQRWERAARSSVFLFQKHPSLRYQIPMFRDKNPIDWQQDPPALIVRKLARGVISSRPAMWSMERVVPCLERHASRSRALELLHRWIASGYIFRGYREGLKASAQPLSPQTGEQA